MRVFLVQHGDAVEKEVDPARPLSPKGLKDVERVAAFLSEKGILFPQIWHSDKVRAAQTASILHQHVGKGGVCEYRPGLAPKDNPKAVCRELAKQIQDTAIVGHLPQLSLVAGYLLTGDERQSPIAFERGAVLCLQQAPDGGWQVEWMIIPQLLAG